MRQSKYIKQLTSLLHRPFFTSVDAEKLGIPRHVLAHFIKKGTLERIQPGTYRSSHYEPKVEFEWENLALIAATTPDGVICLISALCFYQLTDQIMRESWVAIPNKMRIPKRTHARFIRMRNLTLGREKIRLGEYTVYIFDRERCIVDAFRYLSKEIAIKSLQRYLRATDFEPQFKKLAKYAKALKVNLAPYVLAYTT